MKILKISSIAILMISAFLTLNSFKKIAADKHSLTGGGTALEQYDDPNDLSKSTVSINAIDNGSGATGHIEYNYRAGGLTFHADVNCLTVVGNQATVVATVTKVGGKTPELYPAYQPGLKIKITIQDNGKDPDFMSDIQRINVVCDGNPSNVDPPYIPIQGNFTVR